MNALIVGCSRRKTPNAVQTPALDLYQGWCFPWLRERVAVGLITTDQIFILSALHGLVGAQDLVDSYDCELSPTQALFIRPRVAASLRARVLQRLDPDEILVVAEARYYEVLADGLPSKRRPSIRCIHSLEHLRVADATLLQWHLHT